MKKLAFASKFPFWEIPAIVARSNRGLKQVRMAYLDYSDNEPINTGG
jgi:hypothetical protein